MMLNRFICKSKCFQIFKKISRGSIRRFVEIFDMRIYIE